MNNAIILSYKASDELKKFVKNLGYEIVETGKLNIDDRISDHADLQIFPLDKNTFIVEPCLYDYYKEKLSCYGKDVIKGDFNAGSKYPKDCYYNITLGNDYYICKEKIIDSQIENRLDNLEKIYVNQAYTKCMSLVVEDMILTCDEGIHKKLLETKKNSHLIKFEKIKLDGFNSGFFGGACGIIDNKRVLFTGDISQEKDYKKLLKLLKKYGYEVVFPKTDLVDLGSIFLL